MLGRLPVPRRPTYLDFSRAGPIALAIGAGGGCLDIFSVIYHFSFLSPCLWETARCGLGCCLKGPLNPEQPTNQVFRFFLFVLCLLCLLVFYVILALWAPVLQYKLPALLCFSFRSVLLFLFVVVVCGEPRQKQRRGLVDHKLVQAPSNFIAGRPK